MKTVMLHMKMPDDLAEACEGKDLKAEVSAALRARWFPKNVLPANYAEIPEELRTVFGSIPAEQKRV